jgi:thiamine biosynthesis lipoprotein
MVAALDIVDAVEDQLTVYRDVSDVVTINALAGQGPVVAEKHLFELLQLCWQLCRDTDGAFDITSGPLSRVWGFLQGTGRLPDEAEIAAARSRVGIDCWLLDTEQHTITLDNAGVEINFNAIGKGYALDQAVQWLGSQGINDYLWHGGRSSVLARGRNRAIASQRAGDRRHDKGRHDKGRHDKGRHDKGQHDKGQHDNGQHNQEFDQSKPGGWTVGLPHPLQPNQRLADIHLVDSALATAGSKTQFFECAGTCFGHLIDPRTGWPAGKVITATVIAPTAAEADALATAFYIMGPEQAGDYCRRHPQVKSVLICPADQETKIMIHAFGLTPGDWTVK